MLRAKYPLWKQIINTLEESIGKTEWSIPPTLILQKIDQHTRNMKIFFENDKNVDQFENWKQSINNQKGIMKKLK